MIEVCVVTNFGLLSFDIFDADHGPGRFFVSAVKSGQLAQIRFDTLVAGAVLCGGVCSELGGECFGIPCCYSADFAPFLRHVGAGILSCKVGCSESIFDNLCLTLSPQPNIDGRYIVFGRIRKGISVLKRISDLETDENCQLFTPVKFLSVFFPQTVAFSKVEKPFCCGLRPFLRRSSHSVVDSVC